MIGNQAHVWRPVFSADGHFVGHSHYAGAIEGYAQSMGIIVGQNEIGSYAVRLPLKREKVAGDGP